MIIAIIIYSIVLTSYVALILFVGGACNPESKDLLKKGD